MKVLLLAITINLFRDGKSNLIFMAVVLKSLLLNELLEVYYTFKQKYMYNFYLNKLFKFFILLKEIIIIIKTHIKFILNIYNLFSKFYCREREITYDRELKNTTPKHMNPK